MSSIGPGLGGGARGFDSISLHRLQDHDWSTHPAVTVVRHEAGRWVTLGVFGDAEAAMNAIDQAVGRGEGQLEDYGFRVAEGGFFDRHSRATWIVALVIAVALAVFIAAWILHS